MAKIVPYKKASGEVSYHFTVYVGRDSEGRKIEEHATWAPDRPMTAKQRERAAKAAAAEFEKQILQGFGGNNRQTFAEYADYVLELKERSGTKHKTIESYRYLLKRINKIIGSMKLADIRPQHLNNFYDSLAKEGVRSGESTARLVTDRLKAEMKERGLTHETAAAAAGVSSTTIGAVLHGDRVKIQTARKLCAAFDLKMDKDFACEVDGRKLSDKTILEYHRCIQSVLAQAEKEMIVPYNAAAKATAPRPERKEVNYFQPGEIADILNVLEDEPVKWRAIVMLLIATGARRGEIAGLKWKNLDMGRPIVLTINSTLLYSADKGVYENATKTRDVRILKIPEELRPVLKEYEAWHNGRRLAQGDRWVECGYVFHKENGEPMLPDSITQYLNKLSKKHPELPHINPHAFRHSAATAMINSGLDVVTVSKQLGHSRASTTEDIYAHEISEAKARASECIAEVLLRRA